MLIGRDTAKQQPTIEWPGFVVKTGDEVLFTGCFERDTDQRLIGRACTLTRIRGGPSMVGWPQRVLVKWVLVEWVLVKS